MKKFIATLSILLGLGLNAQQAIPVKPAEKVEKIKTEKNKVEKEKKEATKKAEEKVAGAKSEVKLKKDGTPDKRFKDAQHLKKDGTPDKRFKK